ncbi:MAG: hypothetical protein AB1668_02495 [Nanoarchaeota archaeon]
MKYEEDTYIKSRIPEGLKLDNITIRTACALAIGALKKAAARDKESGGPIEVITVRRNKITSYRDILRKNLQETEYKTYDTILAQESAATPTEEAGE